jgi:hypothetical protein
LLDQVDTTVLGVHKAVFAANFGRPAAWWPGQDTVPLILNQDLYKQDLLIQDILTFRAAALAAGRLTSLDELENWRSWYCPPGVKPYRALNKTLDQLPGNVPPRLLLKLQQFVLPRAITNCVELITTILAHGQHNEDVLTRASASEIRDAMGQVSRFIHQDFSLRRWKTSERW